MTGYIEPRPRSLKDPYIVFPMNLRDFKMPTKLVIISPNPQPHPNNYIHTHSHSQKLTSLTIKSPGLKVSKIYTKDFIWIYGTSKCLQS